MSITALKKLRESSKATVVVAVLIVFGILTFLGKMPLEKYEAFTKWILTIWVPSHAVEQSAKAYAAAKKANGNAAANNNAEPAPQEKPA